MREVAAALLGSGHGEDIDVARRLASSFVTNEEMCFVLTNRATEGGAEEVVAEGRFIRREEIPGIELVVAEILEPAAVKLVRTGLCSAYDQSTGRAAELCRVRILHHAEFLDYL